MSISRDQINEAMSRFMGCGGSIRRFEKVVGEPILGSDIWLTEVVLAKGILVSKSNFNDV